MRCLLYFPSDLPIYSFVLFVLSYSKGSVYCKALGFVLLNVRVYVKVLFANILVTTKKKRRM